MNATLDVLVIIIVAAFAYMGYKKGIIRTLLSVAGTFAASILSMILSTPIAQIIYLGGFQGTILEKVRDASALLKSSGKGTLMEKILETMPSYVTKSLKGFKISNDMLANAASKGPEKVEELLRPIVVSFISIIVSAVLFVIFFIVAKIIVKFISERIDDWSLGSVDALMGAVVGIMEGFVLTLMIAFIIRLAVPHMEKVPKIISNGSISHSTVFKGVYDSPLLTSLMASTESPNTEAAK